MIVVPQIPVRGGSVALGEELPPVRLVEQLVAVGAEELGILDLDGTLAAGELPGWLASIGATAGVPLRFDGHLHDGARVERLARAGFATIVVDRIAVFDQLLLRWALDVHGARLAVEVQVDGEHVFDPPRDAPPSDLVELLSQLHFQGVRRIVFRDVTGQQLPLQQLMELGARLPGLRISYQGRAARDVESIARLASAGPVMEAVLVDAHAIVEGELDLAAARLSARVP